MRRSPPGSKEEVIKIAQVIAQKVENLVQRTIGRELPISYLTIFSHTPQEYSRLVELMSELGTKSEANNGFKFMLTNPINTAGGDIGLIRISKPDTYRTQIGCADLDVDSYASFKMTELPKHPDNMRLIVRPEYEMLEFFAFDSNDVLAYIVSK
jgi:hypothetical protein